MLIGIDSSPCSLSLRKRSTLCSTTKCHQNKSDLKNVFVKIFFFSISSILSIPIMLIEINGGYFPAICRVYFNRLPILAVVFFLTALSYIIKYACLKIISCFFLFNTIHSSGCLAIFFGTFDLFGCFNHKPVISWFLFSLAIVQISNIMKYIELAIWYSGQQYDNIEWNRNLVHQLSSCEM